MDFPKAGVNFMDLFSLTSDSEAFKKINEGTAMVIEHEVGKAGEAFNVVVGMDSRGFIQGPILAQMFNLPFLPIRKAGKLPGECYTIEYGTEYSKDKCQIQKNSLKPGSKVLLVDDLLATGGSLKAAQDLVAQCEGCQVVASYCLFEVDFFKGRDTLDGKVVTIVNLKD